MKSIVAENVAEENRQLRRAIRDLVALTAVPAAWIRREPRQIAEETADLLMSALRLDAAYVRLNHLAEAPTEVVRRENCPAFAEWLDSPEAQVRSAAGLPISRRVEFPTGMGTLYIAVTPIGMDAEGGLVAVGAQRSEFPTELEGLLLSVAANQALMSFETSRVLNERRHAEQMLQALREEVDHASMFEEIVGSSPALHGVLSRVAKVAPTDSTVLITGETGTGKELVARAIHKRSRRSGRAFVSVNCAAIPSSLIAAELFGHEKGAFTGALQRRPGRVELAEGGTIFLDEVGELPPETQIALLRVLQEREFERVGDARPITADVRVIAATNRDLEAAIAIGTFRSDLFYRLNVFPIEVPPLRERKQDIRILLEYFIERYANKVGKKVKKIEKKTLEQFESYRWPGNIRELQNVIERSVILCEGETFSVDDSWLSRGSVRPGPSSGSLAERLLDQEKQIIESALTESKGRVAGPMGAAARLGVPPTTLASRIKTLKISKNRFNPD